MSPRTPNRSALTAVEHAKLDAGLVDRPAHQAVERIDFPYEVPFAEASDCRIAGHFPDPGRIVGDQETARAEARGGSRSFTARMAASNDNHIIVCHDCKMREQAPACKSTRVPAGPVSRETSLLPDTEVAKDDIQQILDVHLAHDAPKGPQRQAQVFREKSRLPRLLRSSQGLRTIANRAALP